MNFEGTHDAPYGMITTTSECSMMELIEQEKKKKITTELGTSGKVSRSEMRLLNVSIKIMISSHAQPLHAKSIANVGTRYLSYEYIPLFESLRTPKDYCR